MFERLHARKGMQLLIGLLIGFGFGFLLQRGGVTQYDVILGQLLLTDFTVLKVMLTAVLTGMVGVYVLKARHLVNLHPKPGSLGATVIGGLIFGAGFALLGYCPGTVAGAAAQGSLDALLGGIPGILAGSWLYARLYPRLQTGILQKGAFGKITLPELLRVKPWIAVLGVSVVILAFFFLLEAQGL